MVGCQVMTKTTAMILMIPIPNTKPKPRLVWNVSGQSGHTYTLHVLGPPCQLQVYLNAGFRIRISFTWFRLSLPSLQSDTWLVCFRHLGVKSIISELVSNYPSLRSFWFANCAESALRFNQLNWATPEIWQPLMAELINIKMWMADGGSAACDHQTAAYQRLERIWIWWASRRLVLAIIVIIIIAILIMIIIRIVAASSLSPCPFPRRHRHLHLLFLRLCVRKVISDCLGPGHRTLDPGHCTLDTGRRTCINTHIWRAGSINGYVFTCMHMVICLIVPAPALIAQRKCCGGIKINKCIRISHCQLRMSWARTAESRVWFWLAASFVAH